MTTFFLSSFAGAGWQFFTNTGAPLAGGLIYTYAAGTSTPLATYTTSAGSIANSNPIVLNSAGRLDNEVWLVSSSTYKFVLKDSSGSTIATYDNIPGIADAATIFASLANTTDISLGDALIGFRQASNTALAAGAVGRTVHDKFTEMVSVKDFGAVGDGVTDDTAAIQAAVTFGMLSQNNGTGFGSNNGRTIFFPIGKYRISNAISIYEGCNLLGEQSGLVNSGSGFSTGTVLLLSNTKPGGAAWTSTTLVGGNTIAKRVMFTVEDGGPIEMKNFGAITEGNNSADSIFLLAGNDFPSPYNSVGVTQALFSGLRIFTFGEVFRGTRFADVTIENCGFEYNIYVFAPLAATHGGNNGWGGINSITTQYFANYSTFSIPTGASFPDSNFSACGFSLADNSNGSLCQGAGGDMSNVHFSSCDFVPGTSSSGYYFTNTGTDFLMQGCTFTSCRFKSNGAFQFPYVSTTGRYFRRNVIVGCVFENSNITLNVEGQYNVINSNEFWGTSVVTTDTSFDLVMNGNNFANCSTNPPIVLNGVPIGVSISNNVFASGVTSIPISASATRIKMVGNVYFADVNMP